MRILIVIAILCSSCTTAFYPNGRKAIVIGSNVRGLYFKSGGMELRGDFNNAIIVQKYGAAVSQGIMSAGSAFVTGGIIP